MPSGGMEGWKNLFKDEIQERIKWKFVPPIVELDRVVVAPPMRLRGWE